MSKNSKISVKPPKNVNIKENTDTDDIQLTVEEQFTKLTQHDHILKRPGMYIGSTSSDKITMYVYDDEKNGIVKKDIKVTLGLYKIFDEILVNAADNTVRDNKCNRIDVNINQNEGTIEVKNNGTSVPVEFHKDEKMYVPEMIFGTLLTSSNYNDNEERTVGGCNGIGAKASNIYSSWFDVEIQDTIRHKKYYQRFKNNMYEREKPIITDLPKNNNDSYTKITFLPDYAKFGLESLTNDHVELFKKRVYDIAGTTKNNVKVYYNNDFIDVKTFEDYIKLFYSDKDDEDLNIIYQDFNPRWQIGIVFDTECDSKNPNFVKHVTFVNKISTYDGGTHLNYIMGQIVDKVTQSILTQPKYKTLKIRPAQIKDNLTVFINTTIENPVFGSQTKDALKTKASDFKVKCDIDEAFIKKLCKSGLIDEIVQVAQIKQLAELEKTDGKKVTNLKKLVKLEDARYAGSKQAYKCTLILTEGDSAKSFAISGLEVIGRDYFGVFPLKGKLLNVREATANQLLNNEEIKNLKQILGLKQNKVYKNTKDLRYGHILILTDSDADGSHIKGLVMNFIHTFWPSLAKIDGFIQSIATPIIKVCKKGDTKKTALQTFYTITEYKKWCDKVGDTKGFEIKYYKGLGTSTDKEAKESFIDYEKKIINYIWNKDEKDTDIIEVENDNDTKEIDASETTSVITDTNDKNEPSYQAITLAFAKNRANDRKDWLKEYDPEKIIENSNKSVTFDEFVEYDLKHFSNSDNIRSIPDISDGLKPSQRKILYGAFKRKLDKDEIKVAQLSGYISEHTGYHHGEASLQGAIINMAQDYVGSNNINVFKPNGNFGSRRLGGEDAASPRYIFTQLNKVTKLIYNDKDEPILEYQMEEGDIVEPKIYYPIIPMVLVNGCRGIGTGYATYVPQYNPLELINNIKQYIGGTPFEELDELIPWYRGFTGKIEKKPKNKAKDKDAYNIFGVATIINENTIRIKELPIGVWTENYLQFLESQREDGEFIIDYVNNSSNHKVDIEVKFANGILQYLNKNDLIFTKLKLITSISIENMHLYKDNVITKYKSANSILKDYIEIRLAAYEARKKHVIKQLTNEMQVLKYRKKFIEQILDKEIIIERKKKVDIIQQLVDNEYPELSISLNSTSSYDYLTNLPLFSLTAEKIDDINKEFKEKKDELDTYKNTTVQDLWLHELDEFEKYYQKMVEEEQNNDSNDKKTKSTKTTTKTTNAKKTITVKTDTVKKTKKAVI
jgi:DNA topoisomerase-2